METLGQSGLLIVHVAMGLGLAASAGLRAFLPLFAVGLAARLDWVPLTSSFEWLESTPALTVFGVAVVVELLSDKIPIVDNVLDSLQVVVKPIAGAFVMTSVVSEWSPIYLAIVWIVTGGSLAGLVHLGKAKLRLASSLTTAGMANPVLSAGEDVGAAAGSIVAILLPLVAGALVILAVPLVWLVARRRGRSAFATHHRAADVQ